MYFELSNFNLKFYNIINMKNIVFTILTVLFINLSFSQEKQEIENGFVKYKCDSIIKINSNDEDIIELIGNVEFKTDLVEFINASKVTYNKKTKEVLITEKLPKIIFKGISILEPKNSKRDTLKYKIGEKIVYLL